MNDKLRIGSSTFDSRLLHCFGNPSLGFSSPHEIAQVIVSSGTSFLTLYTHNGIDSYQTIDDFAIGYTGTRFGDIKGLIDVCKYKLLVNTNYSHSVSDAVHKAEVGSRIAGVQTIKLEVLNSSGTRPVNKDVVNAAEILTQKGYEVYPIIDKYDLWAANALVEIGCPCIRVLLSDIGSMNGLTEITFIRRLIEEFPDTPIIAEGGISSPQDVFNVISVGASAVLINASMFYYSDTIQYINAIKSCITAGRSAYLCRRIDR